MKNQQIRPGNNSYKILPKNGQRQKKPSEDTSVSHQKTFSATATKVQWAYVSTLELYLLLLLWMPEHLPNSNLEICQTRPTLLIAKVHRFSKQPKNTSTKVITKTMLKFVEPWTNNH